MQEGEYEEKFKNKIANHKMLLLKNNQILKGLIPLERLFDQNGIPLKSTLYPQPKEVKDYNIGSNESPKLVKLSKYFPIEQKKKYAKLLKEYKYVFSWSYKELKTCDTSIIEHKIPLKPNVKPFKQNLRQVNPIFFLVIEREVKKLLDEKISVPLKYFEWVANLVPVRNKNGEIGSYS
jgi:hypothetical protein